MFGNDNKSKRHIAWLESHFGPEGADWGKEYIECLKARDTSQMRVRRMLVCVDDVGKMVNCKDLNPAALPKGHFVLVELCARPEEAWSLEKEYMEEVMRSQEVQDALSHVKKLAESDKLGDMVMPMASMQASYVIYMCHLYALCRDSITELPDASEVDWDNLDFSGGANVASEDAG